MNLLIRLLLPSLPLWVVVAGCNQTVEVAKPKEPVDPLVRVQAKAKDCTVCHGTTEAQRGPILDGMEVHGGYDAVMVKVLQPLILTNMPQADILIRRSGQQKVTSAPYQI